LTKGLKLNIQHLDVKLLLKHAPKQLAVQMRHGSFLFDLLLETALPSVFDGIGLDGDWGRSLVFRGKKALDVSIKVEPAAAHALVPSRDVVEDILRKVPDQRGKGHDVFDPMVRMLAFQELLLEAEFSGGRGVGGSRIGNETSSTPSRA
jgi:hypothetical protein